MSKPVPQERAQPLAARNDDRPHADPQSPPEPQQTAVSPIDREIARSQRASAALAASAAVARASQADSESESGLEAEAAQAGEGDIDTSAWVRTEYAAFDHSPTRHQSLDEPVTPAQSAEPAEPGARRARSSPHNPVAGTFDPGLMALNARSFASTLPGARAGQPIRTRSGAQARFRQESRHAPRGERVADSAVRHEEPLAPNSHFGYDKAEVMPLLAPTLPAPVPPRGRARPAARTGQGGEAAKFLLAGCMGAIVAVTAAAVAWKQGLLTPGGSPTDTDLVTANVARQAEAARVLSAAERELRSDPPAAGAQAAAVTAPASAPPLAIAPSRLSAADADAILAAAARATSQGRGQVPERDAPSVAVQPALAGAAAARPARSMAAAASLAAPARGSEHERDAVAQAVANAQAKADSFLAPAAAAPKP